MEIMSIYLVFMESDVISCVIVSFFLYEVAVICHFWATVISKAGMETP